MLALSLLVLGSVTLNGYSESNGDVLQFEFDACLCSAKLDCIAYDKISCTSLCL